MRVLWLLVFVGMVGGAYFYAHLPEFRGGPKALPFRWSRLWADEYALPPSERLAEFIEAEAMRYQTPAPDGMAEIDQAKRLFLPGVNNAPEWSAKDLRELAEQLRVEARTADRKYQPVYEAAIATCQTLLALSDGRATMRSQFTAVEKNGAARLGAAGLAATEHQMAQQWFAWFGTETRELMRRAQELQRREQTTHFGEQ